MLGLPDCMAGFFGFFSPATTAIPCGQTLPRLELRLRPRQLIRDRGRRLPCPWGPSVTLGKRTGPCPAKSGLEVGLEQGGDTMEPGGVPDSQSVAPDSMLLVSKSPFASHCTLDAEKCTNDSREVENPGLEPRHCKTQPHLLRSRVYKEFWQFGRWCCGAEHEVLSSTPRAAYSTVMAPVLSLINISEFAKGNLACPSSYSPSPALPRISPTLA